MTNIRSLSYNTHLFGNTLPGLVGQYYKDNERKDAIIEHLISLDLDIICLCEMWDKDYKNDVINKVKSQYAYSYYNSNSVIKIGSGLMILSKHKLYNAAFSPYENLSGTDALSQKGILYVSVNFNFRR